MRRLWAGILAVIAALVAVLFTGHAVSAVQRSPAATYAHTYAYDSQHHPAILTEAATERGPPASYEGDTTPDAVGHRHGGAMARLSTVATATITAYDHPALLVQVASASGVPRTGAAGELVDLSPFERADVAAKSLAGLSEAEVGVANSARAIYSSDAMATLRSAAANGTSAEVRVGGTLVQYEPGLPASGMTMFGENGFLLGPEAFASENELAATIAHESHRLAMTQSAGGLSGGLASSETNAAFEFSKQVAGYVMGR